MPLSWIALFQGDRLALRAARCAVSTRAWERRHGGAPCRDEEGDACLVRGARTVSVLTKICIVRLCGVVLLSRCLLGVCASRSLPLCALGCCDRAGVLLCVMVRLKAQGEVLKSCQGDAHGSWVA